MARGRKPKPTKLKVVTGNPGHRPLNENEPEPVLGIPDMPAWIEPFKHAVENWNTESAVLDDMGIISQADAGVLATRSFLYHQIVELSGDIKTEGTTLESEGREPKHNPKQKQLESIFKEYRTLGSLLGLDPSSRSKLHINPQKGGGEWDDI